jgi:hypothetical protein
MKNLIAVLGFNPNNDGTILPILESRLNDAIKLARENPGSKLLLMGGSTFREKNPNAQDQSLAMKKYVDDHATDILENTEIVLMNEGSSTVRELCNLREFLEKEGGEPKIKIIASEFFVDRVRLYADYIFDKIDDVEFIPSEVPEEGREGFQEIEQIKLQKGHEWLDGRKKGDYVQILHEQESYEGRIMRGEVEHPITRPEIK